MKMNQLFAICGVAAALFCGAGSVSAQQDNGGGGGGRRFDPQQMQQRMMDNVRDQLGFTNDTDWNAVQPLVQKVMDARRDVGFGDMRRLMGFGGRNRSGNANDQSGRPRGGGMFGGSQSPEAQALQTAIDNNAPAAQIKDLLSKYQTSQKAKLDKLKQAQEDLRAVLSVKQEAQATLLGLLN